jgi:hypothetical protein
MMGERSSYAKPCLAAFVLLLLLCGCGGGDGEVVLFQDSFDDAHSGWGEDRRGEFDRGYDEDGTYFFEVDEPVWFAWAHPGKRFTDVRVQVDAQLVSGAQDGHFGVICRYEDADNFYYFAVSADGYYAIFRREDGDMDILTGDGSGMLSSPSIKTGEQISRVVAVCQGDELRFYVNGGLLATVTDGTHAKGDVGLGAGSGAEGRVRFHFDDFVVTEP